MVNTCAAKNCGYVYQKDVRLKVFSFPFGVNTESLLKKWRKNMQVKETLKIGRTSVWGICEQHFLKKCFFDHEQGSRLKVGAVPTLLQVGAENQWRKIAPDYDALGEEHTEELKNRVELDHTYRELRDAPKVTAIEESPAKRRRTAATKNVSPAKNVAPSEDLAAATDELAELKRQLHTQNLQLKRMEEKLKRRDGKREDLQYAVDKLKGVLQCCECGLKPSSEAELAKMLKRKKEKPAPPSTEQKSAPKTNLPTKVVCRNDLVVGLTWKQLFARVNSIAQGNDD